MSTDTTTPVLIVGGGPAAIAVLLAASRIGELPRLLDEGLTLVEREAHIGSGTLGRYVINSDSAAETFVDAITDNPVPELARLIHHPLVEMIRSRGRLALPLRVVADFLDMVGQVLTALITAHPASRILTGWQLKSLHQTVEGKWRGHLASSDGAHTQHLIANKVVLAMGAHQPEQRLHDEVVGDGPLLPRHAGRVMQSDELLSPDGITRLRTMTAGQENPRIAVIGGASSALSAAHVIMRDMADRIAPGNLTLLHKSRLKLFYRTAAEAVADGYTEFHEEDICPVSQFVYRFGGLRYDSRRLAMQLMGIAGAPPEPRLRDVQITDSNHAHVKAIVDNADAIIACLGYRPRRITMIDAYGRPIALSADTPDGCLTGPECGILNAAGQEIPGLFGLGLASGFRPTGAMGGEASFRGQVNSLWLWQTAIGEKILHHLLPPETPLLVPTPRLRAPMLEPARGHLHP
ncbi:FAD-dependent oxidoreductase [Komagataeibacter swingsii]|uniref:Aminotransferase DegT n=1 Tax=Komagataeibacter swingsii TaxID=215220 RepID=A0A850NXE4_9PROT|nr:FAD-dependent oxidoreductase [Komagataeibacter swingsii]NVN36987.1 aminotransferase DegT [Komagataeibacter swingsii]